MMEEDAKRKLKAAELQAKKDRLKIWTTYVPPQTNSTAILDVNFSGKVIKVVSGDCVVVAGDAAPYGSPVAERRVNLSSIRAPRIGNPKKDEKPAAYAREAKEYLHNLLIGQQVNVTMEYSQTIGAMDGPIPAPAALGSEQTMDFGSVFVVSAAKGEAADTTLPALAVPEQPQGMNVAEMLVVRGFATVVRHRDFEKRSNGLSSPFRCFFYHLLVLIKLLNLCGGRKSCSTWVEEKTGGRWVAEDVASVSTSKPSTSRPSTSKPSPCIGTQCQNVL